MAADSSVSKPLFVHPPLVYVWLGDELPHWARQAFELSAELCGVDTVLLCSRTIQKVDVITLQIALEDFYNAKPDDHLLVSYGDIPFRNGFWSKTTERFLVLKRFQTVYQVKSFFHAELDNIVFNLSGLASTLDNYGVGCFVPRDRVDRGIASLIYINSNFPLEKIESILSNRLPVAQNDMELLGMLLQSDSNFIALPTEHALTEDKQKRKWCSVPLDVINGLFDAAAIGQFLFGIDVRNSNTLHYNAFVNENSGYDLWEITFQWPAHNAELKLIRKTDGKSFNLYNLHVHSKLFSLIIQDQKLRHILKRINNRQRTLLKINLWQNRLFKSIMIRVSRAVQFLHQNKY